MEKIGIEPFALLTQVINFTIMVVILTKILYKPILKIIEERKKKIEEGLLFAQKAKQELETSEKKKQEIIKEARDEANKIIEEGKKTGKKLESEIIEKARKEAVTIVEKGKIELDTEHAVMEKRLATKTVEIATSIARKLLEQVLSPTDQQAIINRKIKEIAKLADKIK